MKRIETTVDIPTLCRKRPFKGEVSVNLSPIKSPDAKKSMSSKGNTSKHGIVPKKFYGDISDVYRAVEIISIDSNSDSDAVLSDVGGIDVSTNNKGIVNGKLLKKTLAYLFHGILEQ